METILYNDEIAYKTKYEGYYVTTTGKVITVKVKGGQGSLDYSNPREHCYKIDKDGYFEVCISFVENNEHKRKYIRVHRLVYETLVGHLPLDATIDHIDSNVQHNNIENLQIMSRADNTRKALKGKKSSKRYFYHLHKNDTYLGMFDRKELFDLIGLRFSDFYRNTSNKRQLLLQGYTWNLASVEDIERVL